MIKLNPLKFLAVLGVYFVLAFVGVSVFDVKGDDPAAFWITLPFLIGFGAFIFIGVYNTIKKKKASKK
jgi:hypothetical protein